MAEQQLVDYIKKAKTSGQSDSQTRSLLAKNGWTDTEISDAFSVASVAQPAVARPQPQSQPRPQTQPQQPQTRPQVSGQPRVEVRPKPEPHARPAQPQQPTQQPRHYQPQTASSMPRTKRGSGLLLKLFIIIILVIVLAGAGLYSVDRFLGINVLSYFNIKMPWDFFGLFGESPQVVLDKMFEKAKSVKTSSSVVQFNIGIASGDTAYATAYLNVEGVSDVTDANNPKGRATLSFTLLPQQGAEMQKASANLDIIAIGEIAYIRINDVSVPGDAFPDLSSVKGQFLRFDQASATALAEEGGSIGSAPLSGMNSIELSNKMRELVLAENIFTLDKEFPNETINGKESHHYALIIPKDKLRGLFNQAIALQVANTPELASEPGFTEAYVNSMVETVGDINVEVWIGKADYMLYRVLASEQINLSEIIPLLNLQLNIGIDATYTGYNEAVSVQEPPDAQRIEDVLPPLFGPPTAESSIRGKLSVISDMAFEIKTTDLEYTSLCSHSLLNGYNSTYGAVLISANNDIVSLGGSKPACFASADSFCISAQLPDGTFTCRDSGGSGIARCLSAQTPCSEELPEE